jgi:hypothetical protein
MRKICLALLALALAVPSAQAHGNGLNLNFRAAGVGGCGVPANAMFLNSAFQQQLALQQFLAQQQFSQMSLPPVGGFGASAFANAGTAGQGITIINNDRTGGVQPGFAGAAINPFALGGVNVGVGQQRFGLFRPFLRLQQNRQLRFNLNLR